MANFSVNDSPARIIEDGERWRQNAGLDPARYLVQPGRVRGAGDHSAGQLRHARPYIVSGNRIFVFPVGVEGFRREGQANITTHRYLNEVAVDAHVFHREEAHIELSGTFPGIHAQQQMIECISILRSKPPVHLVLYAPGVFENQQYVVAEDWNFTHVEEDRTHSIAYTIRFLRTGEGSAVKDKPGTPAPANPSSVRKPKGKPTRLFTVASGAQTLRLIASVVYHNADAWQRLVTLNQDQIANFQRSNILNQVNDLPAYSLPTYRWPVGTRFRY